MTAADGRMETGCDRFCGEFAGVRLGEAMPVNLVYSLNAISNYFTLLAIYSIPVFISFEVSRRYELTQAAH